MLDYKIKTTAYEGPLEALVELIEKRKLFINDISLAQVTDDFIAYIKSFDSFPMEQSAQFILVASTLLLIKSKSLLPTIELTEDEQASIEDLQDRLKQYQKIKDLSVHIKERFGKNFIFPKTPSKIINPVFSPDKDMTGENLLSAIRKVIQELPKTEVMQKVVVKKVISLEETITKLADRIRTGLKMSFKTFTHADKAERVNVIVSFLAMLELVKQGIINVEQEKAFDDIRMETRDISVPMYN
ncbi:MAG: ScpA family protein [Candidatus Paceibacterota bacterium]|jgi:segregation and condensation protein A